METASLPVAVAANPPGSSSAPVASWPAFLRYFRTAWKQGEHVTLIGPTGQGKTTLAEQILPIRRYVVVLANKPRDDTMSALARRGGYEIQENWMPDIADRIILWPPTDDMDSVADEHKLAFASLFRSVWRSGGWCVYVDEATYIADQLKLKKLMELLWQMGRSSGVSIVAGTQRPVNIPLYAYDMATHLFFWGDNDEVNIRRIANLGGLDANPIRRDVMGLDKYEVLYLNTRTGQRFKTKVEVK